MKFKFSCLLSCIRKSTPSVKYIRKKINVENVTLNHIESQKLKNEAIFVFKIILIVKQNATL